MQRRSIAHLTTRLAIPIACAAVFGVSAPASAAPPAPEASAPTALAIEPSTPPPVAHTALPAEPSAPLAALAKELNALRTQPPLHEGVTAIYVVDANTGDPLFAAHEDALLNPASNVKLISTAAALDTLGPDWRYTTRLFGTRTADDPTAVSELYLAGSYDPTFDDDGLAELADQIAAAGITDVRDGIWVGSDPQRDSIGWPRLTMFVRGTKPGQPPTVKLDLPVATKGLSDEARQALIDDFIDLEVTAETIKARRRPDLDVSITLLDTPSPRYRVTVAGHISRKRSKRIRRRVPSPQLYTANLLRIALARVGVTVASEVLRRDRLDYVVDSARRHRQLPTALAEHRARPLAELIARVNKRSLNRMADRVVMTAAAMRYGGAPTMQRGVRLMHAWLSRKAALDPNQLYVDTGSGLSYNTELSARQIVRIVRAAAGLIDPASPATEPTPESGGAALIAMTAPPSERESSHDPDEDSTRRFGLEAGDGLQPDEPATANQDLATPSPQPPQVAIAAPAPSLPDAQTLTAKPADERERVFVDSLAVGGVDGTLRGRFRGPLRGHVRAKTGTLTEVIALSGLVSHGDDTIAFAIVSNGHKHRRRRLVRRKHEAIVTALHRYLQQAR
ncbi:MAG: hypothetical protein Tsb0020_46380 [Haliangiales bacterium]